VSGPVGPGRERRTEGVAPANPVAPPTAGSEGGTPSPPSKPAYDIRRVGEAEVLPIQMLLAVCGRHMATVDGFENWRTPYPLDRLRADAREREVYAVREGPDLVATFTVADRPVNAYEPGVWAEPEASALYVNRLAVMPAHQGRRLGAACMRWIERHAARHGYRAVRLDALAANERLLGFYRRLGYRERGRRAHGGWEFVCFERAVQPV
jgi:ribosomal protein S18 acetylase RimI-like enzyme